MKPLLRKKAKKVLDSLNDPDLDNASKLIGFKLSKILSDLSLNSNEMVLGVFSPLNKEVKWFLSFNPVTSVSIALVHMNDDQGLSFHPCDKQLIESQKFGLKLDESIRTREAIPNVILVPGLAFDQNGGRMGRGAGCYDRYLKGKEVVKIGLCFEEQIFDKLVIDEHDIQMDMVITDKNIYKKGITR